jgi:hypothetical protein
MKFLGCDLDAHQHDQGEQENGASRQVAQIHGHRDGVAAGSPRVVARTLMTQKPSVTSGTLFCMHRI